MLKDISHFCNVDEEQKFTLFDFSERVKPVRSTKTVKQNEHHKR